jgi:site-specific DNA recombinase
MAEAGRVKPIRCAIYTRKSSEEGLEQDFNSLQAQREACEAFIASQKHEGWRAIAQTYDDGGFSGGSLNRPALQMLMEEIAAGKIDAVVVYKVDRLTRSLTDFAKIVEVFDRNGVSFVSVTQAFNTTSSMGRLTLNVLLSFAQFEREVTGERIRDKVAASKKKGLWMGGWVPLGYEAAGRTLAINESEAATIRIIYARYLELRSVDALKGELDRLGLKTRVRHGVRDQTKGAKPFARGHLYRILSNPIYAGRIQHKDQIHPGQHPAIIDQPTWDRAQASLAANSHARLLGARARNPSLLSGLLFDQSGKRLVATHANRRGRRYRYYLSDAAIKHRRPGRPTQDALLANSNSGPIWRLPASDVEDAVIRILVAVLRDKHWLADHVPETETSIADRRTAIAHAGDLANKLAKADLVQRRVATLMLVERVVLAPNAITIALSLRCLFDAEEVSSEKKAKAEALGDPLAITIERPFTFQRRGAEMHLVIQRDSPPEPEADPALVKAVGQAHCWWGELTIGRYATVRELAVAHHIDERYVAWILPFAFLCPDLTRRILRGTQPAELTVHRIMKAKDFPMQWSRQSGW